VPDVKEEHKTAVVSRIALERLVNQLDDVRNDIRLMQQLFERFHDRTARELSGLIYEVVKLAGASAIESRAFGRHWNRLTYEQPEPLPMPSNLAFHGDADLRELRDVAAGDDLDRIDAELAARERRAEVYAELRARREREATS